jgi:hypothetical protein
MTKKQKYTLIIFLSFIFLFILTSIVSYHEGTSYHNLDNNFFIAIKSRHIQPLYNTTALWIWCIGIFFLILFTYLYFRKYDDEFSKKILVDYKLLLKTSFIYIGILYFIGISGEYFPSFYIGEEEINLISETEYKENTNITESDFDEFNKENWIEI